MDPVIQALEIFAAVLDDADRSFRWHEGEIRAWDYSQEIQRLLLNRIEELKKERRAARPL